MSNMKRTLLGILALGAFLPVTEGIDYKPQKPLKLRGNRGDTTILPNGVKPFYYGDNVVFAINQKNADRKARNLGFIQ